MSHKKPFLHRIWTIFPLLFALMSCGSGGEPVNMDFNAAMTIGQATNAAPIKGLFNPDTQNVTGTLEAQIIEEFNDRFELSVLNLDLTADFANVGTVNLELDPNHPSTLIVYKLNRNNQPEGTNELTLNFIVELPEQNLVFDNIILASNTSILSLVAPIPTTSFLYNGEQFELDITELALTLAPGLVISDFDPI